MSKKSRILVFAGAGASQESGLDVFRGSNGLWSDHDVDRICNERTWRSNRDEVMAFYEARRQEIARARPNACHGMVARLQKYRRAQVITTNIDDLFEAAGCHDVLHVHGRIDEIHCIACGNVARIGLRSWDAHDVCPACGSRKGLRPHVVFFNGRAPLYSKMWHSLDSLGEHDVLVVIGASGVVVPIHEIARNSPATTILSDMTPPDDTAVADSYNHYVTGPAAQKAVEVERLVREIVSGRQARA